MSAESVETIISRAMSEPSFADLLFSEPDQAIAGYDLTAEEVANLRALPRADFDVLAGAGPDERRSFGSALNISETSMHVRR